jgi:excinuclease UvrABC nuclease subunit
MPFPLVPRRQRKKARETKNASDISNVGKYMETLLLVVFRLASKLAQTPVEELITFPAPRSSLRAGAEVEARLSPCCGLMIPVV